MRDVLRHRPGLALHRREASGAGFTLIEALLSVAILSALFIIVNNAIDIPAVLIGTENTIRQQAAKQLEHALHQYGADHGVLLQDHLLPLYPETMRICREGVTGDSTCANFDALIIEKYLSALPVDPLANQNHTGYSVSKNGKWAQVTADFLGALPGGG